MASFHILVIRFSSLGDIILNSSIFPALKQRWQQDVEIGLLTSKQFAPLVQGHPHIDKVYGFSRKKGVQGLLELFSLVKEIKSTQKIDLIIDLHGTLRSLAIRARFWYLPRVYTDKRTLERWLLCGLKFDLLSMQRNKVNPRKKSFGEPILKRLVNDFSGLFDLNDNFESLSAFLLGKNTCPGQLSSMSQAFIVGKNPAQDFIQSGPYIVFAPSASFEEKRWPVMKFKELIQRLLADKHWQEYKFIITAGPEDHFCDVFNSLSQSHSDRVLNLQGKTDLVGTAYLVKNASFCVGNDTGVPHMAEAVGTPAVFILGPTGQEFGFYPHLQASQTTFVDLWCRPCTTNGKGRCIRSQRFCLTEIGPELVLEKMLALEKSLQAGPNA